jgi:PQQ enzyme repeat
VFIGDPGADSKGAKGRMYALNAGTGKIVWEFRCVVIFLQSCASQSTHGRRAAYRLPALRVYQPCAAPIFKQAATQLELDCGIPTLTLVHSAGRSRASRGSCPGMDPRA